MHIIHHIAVDLYASISYRINSFWIFYAWHFEPNTNISNITKNPSSVNLIIYSPNLFFSLCFFLMQIHTQHYSPVHHFTVIALHLMWIEHFTILCATEKWILLKILNIHENHATTQLLITWTFENLITDAFPSAETAKGLNDKRTNEKQHERLTNVKMDIMHHDRLGAFYATHKKMLVEKRASERKWWKIYVFGLSKIGQSKWWFCLSVYSGIKIKLSTKLVFAEQISWFFLRNLSIISFF